MSNTNNAPVVTVDQNGEIVENTPRRTYDDDTLRGIGDYKAALALAAQTAGTELESTTDYGNGFAVLPTDEKGRLEKVPFVILEWDFHDGDKGRFVSALIVTKSGEKLILNDGSTGILRQLTRITESRVSRGVANPQASLTVPGGLRRSDYTTAVNGSLTDATTFYLSE